MALHYIILQLSYITCILVGYTNYIRVYQLAQGTQHRAWSAQRERAAHGIAQPSPAQPM